MFKQILNYAKHPSDLLKDLDNHHIIKINDKTYLKIRYKRRTGKKLNLRHPKTFNEKLQWLKLYDHNQKYTKMADKYEAKKYVQKIIGKKYIIPTIGIYDDFDEINFNKLPKKFVIKCTHDSGGLIICKDKKTLNISQARKKINKSLRKNYYYSGREWPYKNIKPRIIVEKFIEDDTIDDLRDYKFMCFNGEPQYVYITVKNDNIFEDYYDMDFKPVNIKHGFPRSNINFQKPALFEKMKDIARRLSKDIPFLRVDLHYVNGEILFGEMTFYDWAGFMPFETDEQDKKFGSLIKLPKRRRK